MRSIRRAGFGALVLGAVCLLAACVPAPEGGGGDPPPPPAFPDKGCYQLTSGGDIEVVNLIDTVNNAAVRSSNDGTCKPFDPPNPNPGLRWTLVNAVDKPAAVLACEAHEPGTVGAAASNTLIVQGTADVFQCQGGIAAGDCFPNLVVYDGPINEANNAAFVSSPDCAARRGDATIVVASSPSQAALICADLLQPSVAPMQILARVFVCR